MAERIEALRAELDRLNDLVLVYETGGRQFAGHQSKLQSRIAAISAEIARHEAAPNKGDN
jgi:uncharacterized small protein (DUF1192 family)